MYLYNCIKAIGNAYKSYVNIANDILNICFKFKDYKLTFIRI